MNLAVTGRQGPAPGKLFFAPFIIPDVYTPLSPSPGVNLQGDPSCAISELSLGCGNEEEKEDDCGCISETISPSSSSRTIKERDKLTVKVGIVILRCLCLPVV